MLVIYQDTLQIIAPYETIEWKTNKDLQSAFTWNLFPQNVLVESNENICITVRQFPQLLAYVTLAEEIICHICPVCGKQMIE